MRIEKQQQQMNKTEGCQTRKFLKKDNRRSLHGMFFFFFIFFFFFFCNMSLGEEFTKIFMNMTLVSYVGRDPQL